MDVLRIATAGSVDDGKSTLIGRLLFETNSITKDKLEALEKASQRKGIGFLDLSLLTDGLIAEREQGITIDVAHIYFNTPKRKFIIADTPGHVEYTRNMITGASKANVSLILIDARHGIVEQTYRHFLIASLLCVPTVVVCINKMDLVAFSEKIFNNIQADFENLATSVDGFKPQLIFIPISSLLGDNLTSLSLQTPWYTGHSLLHILEHIQAVEPVSKKESRLPIQYVIRPRNERFHDFRGYAGRLLSGRLAVGDPVTVLPSGRSTRINKLLQYTHELQEAVAGQSFTLTLEDDLDISRGDMLVKSDEVPKVISEFKSDVCWLHQQPLLTNKTYLLQHGTSRTKAKVTHIQYVVDPIFQRKIESRETLGMNDIARVILRTAKPLPIDPYRVNKANGSFILIDETTNQTVGVGLNAL